MENLKNCPVCGSEGMAPYLSCTDHTVSQQEFTVQKCGSCGFLFTNPRPDSKEIGPYYESKDYISHTNSKAGLFNKVYQTIRNVAIKQKINLIWSLSPAANLVDGKLSILDIGCGTGEFLAGCRNAGWVTKGIEPGDSARNMAIQNHKLDVKGEAELNTTTEKFDVITMWHVLEHVHNLNERVEQLNRLLKETGVLIIAVPNHTSFDAAQFGKHWAAWDVPRHLYHFSPSSLKNLLHKHGFQHVRSFPMKFDAYYVSLLSTGYRDGKKSALRGFLSGYKSNSKAKSDPEKYSSVIYAFKKG